MTMVSRSQGSPVSSFLMSAPEIDDLLTAAISAAGAAELMAMSEVVGKRLAHRLEAASNVSLNRRCTAVTDMTLSLERF